MEILGRVIGKPKKLSPSELHKQSVASTPFYKERPINRRAAKAEAQQRKFQEQQAKLQRANIIAAERTKLAQQRAERAKLQPKSNFLVGTATAIRSLSGAKSSPHAYSSNVGGIPKSRAVYISTSHGLKRIKPDDPRYAGAMAQTQAPPPTPKRVSVMDDDDQPSAFRGL